MEKNLLLYRWTAFKRDGTIWDAGISWAKSLENATVIARLAMRLDESGEGIVVKIGAVLYPASPFAQVST